MQKYSQPDFFKFGHDSLELVQFISQKREKSDLTFLEIGTGCGIIAIELALKFPEIVIDALEPLPEFHPFIKENIETFGVSNLNLIPSRFEDYSCLINKKYDVIYFNPPYFWELESRASPNPLRDHCRRMKKEMFFLWIKRIEKILTSRGKVFLSYRSHDIDKKIERSNIWEIKNSSKNNGSFLVFLQKNYEL